MKVITKSQIFILVLLILFGLIYLISGNARATPPLIIDQNDDAISNLPAQYIYKLLDQQKLIMKQGGWLYIKTHRTHDIDAENFGVFSNGQELPKEYIFEDWFFINERGLIEQSVSIQTAMDGDIVQVGVYSDGTSWNTAVDEVRYQAPASFIGFDAGLQSELNNETLTMIPVVENDKQLMKYDFTLTEKEPVLADEYFKPQTSMKMEYFFDQSTGFLLRFKQTVFLEDGTQRIFDFFESDYQIGREPPPDVLAYFDKKQERVGSK